MSFPRNELIIGCLPSVSRFSQPKWIVIYLHVTSQSKNWSLPNFQFFGSMTSHSDPYRVKHSWKSSSTSNHGVLGQEIAILLRFPSGLFRRFESVLATGEKGERWKVEKKNARPCMNLLSKKMTHRYCTKIGRATITNKTWSRKHRNSCLKENNHTASALVQAPITKTHYRKLSHMSQAKPNKNRTDVR